MTGGSVDVALLAYGGPETPAQVAPFLERLMGRVPDAATVAAVKERYALIGGASPLPGITVRLKVVSEMNIAETRAPQDGRLSLTLNGRVGEFGVRGAQLHAAGHQIPALHQTRLVAMWRGER